VGETRFAGQGEPFSGNCEINSIILRSLSVMWVVETTPSSVFSYFLQSWRQTVVGRRPGTQIPWSLHCHRPTPTFPAVSADHSFGELASPICAVVFSFSSLF
jgi:hypothetical protein